MEYATLFAVMGTALVFFVYKTISLHMMLRTARSLVLGIALGDVEIQVNHKTKEINLQWKEEQ